MATNTMLELSKTRLRQCGIPCPKQRKGIGTVCTALEPFPLQGGLYTVALGHSVLRMLGFLNQHYFRFQLGYDCLDGLSLSWNDQQVIPLVFLAGTLCGDQSTSQ